MHAYPNKYASTHKVQTAGQPCPVQCEAERGGIHYVRLCRWKKGLSSSEAVTFSRLVLPVWFITLVWNGLQKWHYWKCFPFGPMTNIVGWKRCMPKFSALKLNFPPWEITKYYLFLHNVDYKALTRQCLMARMRCDCWFKPGEEAVTQFGCCIFTLWIW